ncbi:aBC transporter permease/ATP-binding protein [Candidatus Colimorpha enterica]|uniref:ABC transporter permease/ATP-binding protein n=1 Tax=Candidatus Colimorpha enterica TaxID=3083063 RepID=R6TMF6_9BACT|nr:aBC transporter permease/ATP-binding protein [Candidatus Colimorpha enterica]
MLKLLKNMRRKEIIMALICIVLIVGQVYFDLRLPDYMTDLTSLIKTSGSTGNILNVGLKMLGCTAVSAVLAIACGFLAAKTASGFSYTVRGKLFHHIMDIGSEEMQDFSVPSLITRTTNDITQIQMVISMGLQMIIKAPIMAVWAVIKILGKSWELSAVTAGFVVVLCGTVLAIMATCIPRLRLVQKMTDRINRAARENLTGISVVHAFNAEDFQNRKFDVPSRGMMELQMKNQKLFALVQPVMSLGMNGLALCIYWLGAAIVNGIALSDPAARISMFSEVIVFSTYATYIVMSFMMLVMIYMLLPQAQVSAERINEVLDRRASVREGKTETAKETGTVSFRNVSFRYPGSGEDELSDISFDIGKGQTLAIIGATGSGKTTLVSLIARFYDATSGEVLVDGVNVKNYTFDALYDRIGYVTQKAVLFAGTVKDNIFFGESAAENSGENLSSALSLSQSEEFVSRLDGGADHEIAQLGRNVSGGQKQRLSIARALARKPEILIFDDSFSALDYRTDAALREGLAKELPETTKIIVAQRISTVRHADRIIVLDRGEAVGTGTHDELMKTCPVYREIAESQLSASELR